MHLESPRLKARAYINGDSKSTAERACPVVIDGSDSQTLQRTLLTHLKVSGQPQKTVSRNMEHSMLRHKFHIIFVRKLAPKVIPSTSPTLELLSRVVLEENPF